MSGLLDIMEQPVTAKWMGSTSLVTCVRPGVVLKQPSTELYEGTEVYEEFAKKNAHEFHVEKTILESIGFHPRIVKYYGWQDEPHSQTGILLARASHGSLQNYLEIHPEIPLPVQQKWCRQVAESISFLHENDVLHLDLRPDNFLVHQTSPESLDLWLCDFGGSKCEKLGVDGGHLPDPGFFDPNVEWVAAKSVDIFSVGSILYSIVTGHWPYRKPGPFTEEESLPEYDQRVEELFRRREFPNVNGLFCGDIVLGCWHGEYNSIDDVIRALDEEDSLDGVESVCEGGSDSYRQGRREQLERHREVVR